MLKVTLAFFMFSRADVAPPTSSAGRPTPGLRSGPKLHLLRPRDHQRQGRVLQRVKIKQAPRGEEIHLRGFAEEVREHRVQEDAR